MRLPAHPRAQARLGDHQRLGPFQEGADLGRHRHHGVAAPQHLDGGVAQEAEPAAGHAGMVGAVRVAVLAQAQQHEMPVAQPVEEGAGLGPFLGRQGGGRVRVGGGRLGQVLDHRGVVGRRHGDVGIDPGQAGMERGAGRLVVDAVEMDVDEALAGEPAGLAACLLRGGLADDPLEAPSASRSTPRIGWATRRGR